MRNTVVRQNDEVLGEPIGVRKFNAAFEYLKRKNDGTSKMEVMIFDQGKVRAII